MTVRAALWLMITGFVTVAGSCASKPAAPVASRSLLERVDAFHGSRLVITLPRAPGTPSELATLDDGVRLKAGVYRVLVTFPTGDATEGWLPAAGSWTTVPLKEKPQGSGPWAVVIDMPEVSDAKVLTIGDQRYDLNWLPSTALLPLPEAAPSEPLLNPWRPVIEGAQASNSDMLARVRDESISPITRWRYRLLLDGLNPVEAHPGAAPFSDGVIEAIAQQNESRWRIALAWLWSANPELAWRLKQRLAAVVDFGGGVYAPAWSVDHASLDRLLKDLLDPTLTPKRRGELAEAWLRDQPSGVAWLIDDGGMLGDERRNLIAAVGFSNLTDTTTRAAVDTSAGRDAEFRPLLSLTTLKLLVPVPACEDQATLVSQLSAHIGRSDTLFNALCGRIPVRPPGMSIGPLLRDYTMRLWERGNAPAEEFLPRNEWTTAALLHRPPPDPTAPPSAVESRRWEMVVECRISPGIKDPDLLGQESVQLYFGPTNRPSSAMKVALNGTVTNELPMDPLLPPEMRAPPGKTEVTRGADRWSFRISLPPGAVEKDGIVRLGMTRIDAFGRRSAWPRPMLPWQSEPGRAALDIGAWARATEAPTEP